MKRRAPRCALASWLARGSFSLPELAPGTAATLADPRRVDGPVQAASGCPRSDPVGGDGVPAGVACPSSRRCHRARSEGCRPSRALQAAPRRRRRARAAVRGGYVLGAGPGAASGCSGSRDGFNYAGGPPPQGIAELGAEIWRGNKPPAERGLLRGSSVPRATPFAPRLAMCLVVILFCASTRANHARRTIPPSLVAPYAAAHDAAIRGTLQACMCERAADAECPTRAVAMLPASLGGLGLHSAVRTAPGAYWAAWADALAVLQLRCPAFADSCTQSLAAASGPRCLREAAAARRLNRLGGHARVGRPGAGGVPA